MRLRLRVVGRAGEEGDWFGLPRRPARTAEGITAEGITFEATLPVFKHCVNGVLAWHAQLALPAPLAGQLDYKRFVQCLSRFQSRPRRIIFPIYASAVKRLLAYRVPDHPPCGGVAGRCAVCVAFLHGWRNCLAGGTATLICPRGAEVAELQTCDLWQRFDERAGYTRSGAGQQSTSRSSIRSTYCGCRAGTHKMWPRGAKSSLAAQPCSTRPGRPSTFELILCTVPCYKGMASWAGAGRQPRDTGLPDLGRPAT